MRDGKAEIEEVVEETGDFSFVPNPDAFEVRPNPVRRTLTPRDVEHNRQVDKFFNTLIPGLPVDKDVPQLRPPVTPFSEVIEATLKRLNIQSSPFLEDLEEKWPTLLPPAIAKLTRPGKWDNNLLYVYVPTSTHLFELRRTALHTIEEAVRACAGTTLVRQVRLMVETREVR
jgi:Dna[CI] antecedent, DciA